MKPEGGEHASAIEESLWALRNSYSDGNLETSLMNDLEFTSDHVGSPNNDGMKLCSARQEDDVMSIGLDFLLEGTSVGDDDRGHSDVKLEVAESGTWPEDEAKSLFNPQKQVMVSVGSPSSSVTNRDLPPSLISPVGPPKSAQPSARKALSLGAPVKHSSPLLPKRDEELFICRPHSDLGQVYGVGQTGKEKLAVLSQQNMVPRTQAPLDSTEFRAKAIARFRAKKASRKNSKLVRYECRKRIASTRPRIGGRFAKTTKP